MHKWCVPDLFFIPHEPGYEAIGRKAEEVFCQGGYIIIWCSWQVFYYLLDYQGSTAENYGHKKGTGTCNPYYIQVKLKINFPEIENDIRQSMWPTPSQSFTTFTRDFHCNT